MVIPQETRCGDQRSTAEFGYQRTISPNKIGKILSQMNHLTKMALGESYAVEIQASGERLRDISIRQIDEAIAQKGHQDGCSRLSIRFYADSLRAFFRYAEMKGW